jgi:hypothetical protein
MLITTVTQAFSESEVLCMNGTYKYNPDDFNGILNLPDGFRNFYKFFEVYHEDRSRRNWFEFRRHWEDLFFVLKAREVEGSLNPVTAGEIRNYLEVLVND